MKFFVLLLFMTLQPSFANDLFNSGFNLPNKPRAPFYNRFYLPKGAIAVNPISIGKIVGSREIDTHCKSPRFGCRPRRAIKIQFKHVSCHSTFGPLSFKVMHLPYKNKDPNYTGAYSYHRPKRKITYTTYTTLFINAFEVHYPNTTLANCPKAKITEKEIPVPYYVDARRVKLVFL